MPKVKVGGKVKHFPYNQAGYNAAAKAEKAERAGKRPKKSKK